MASSDDVQLFNDPASAVHLGGLSVLPLLGIVADSPEVLGIEADRDDHFPRMIRTIHASLAVVTASAFFLSWPLD
ncbi:MAG: hypothetical protein ABEN55_22755 [Bradymonadaceae bacterium]